MWSRLGKLGVGHSSKAPQLLRAFAILALKKQAHQSGQGSESQQPSPYLKPEWSRGRARPELNSCIWKPDNAGTYANRGETVCGRSWNGCLAADVQPQSPTCGGRAGLCTSVSPREATAAPSHQLLAGFVAPSSRWREKPGPFLSQRAQTVFYPRLGRISQ